MRTRKLRLLSALLAVAMMFMLTPTAAFADDDDSATQYVESLSFNEDGTPNVEGITKGTVQGVSGLNNAVGYMGTGWFWDDANKKLFIVRNYTYSADYCGITSPITCTVQNQGTIADGKFDTEVMNNGIIAGGIYQGVSNLSGGTVNGGIIKSLSNNGSSVFNNGLVWGSATFNNSNVYGGIFTTNYSGTGASALSFRKLSANECTINGHIENEAVIVGNTSYSMTVTTSTKKFNGWTKTGLDNVTVTETENTEDKSVELEFTMPTNDVTISVSREPTELKVGASGLPEDEDGFYKGYPDTDGWEFNESKNALTIEEAYIAKLQNAAVDWTIINKGKLIGGAFTGSINNYGTIESGRFENSVNNYGNVKTGTFAGYFSNREDEESGATGSVESGVFSQYANFGTQNPALTWLNVKGGKVNDAITGMASVVGQQKVTVTATVSPFEGWVYSGEVSDAVAKQIEEQKNKETMTLELDGEAEDSIVLTAKTDGEAFALTMLDGKASVNGTNVTAAVPGQTVTLTLDDSEIPEGMSFDHWVISPDVELEGDFKATDRTTRFTMPAQELTIYASLRTDSDDGMDMATVVAGVAVGAGVAYLGYQVGTELYAKQILGDGVAIPRTRADVALTAWQLAGKPEVAVEGEPLSEAAMAQKWAVESGLMQNVDGSFNPDKKMSKIKALKVLDAAKKM